MVAHGVVQSVGLDTVTELVQVPFVAVIVTAVPRVIPVTEFPDTVPELALICDPELAVNDTL